MVDKILFLPWVEVEIENNDLSTTKAGWAPLPGGYRALTRTFPIKRAVAVDKTAWDWTTPWWVLKSYLDIKMAQCRDPDTLYWHMSNLRFQQVVGPLAEVVFPDGTTLMQSDYGLMKSGWLLTLSANSAAQFLQASVTWQRLKHLSLINEESPLPYMWAMGDDMLLDMPEEEIEYYPEMFLPPGRMHWNVMECDCTYKLFERYHVDLLGEPRSNNCQLRRAIVMHNGHLEGRNTYPEFLEMYSLILGTTGCIVKHAIPSREFAGFSFGTSGQPEPLYANKHKYMLKHVSEENEQDVLKSFVLLYALVPGFGWLGDWLERANFPIGPHFKAWALGVSQLRGFLSPKETNFTW